MTLNELADAVERAEGPNFALEQAIGAALGTNVHGTPAYTASLDAAMTLVPDQLRIVTISEIARGQWATKLGNRNASGGLPCAAGTNAARSTTAAALRARAMEDGHG